MADESELAWVVESELVWEHESVPASRSSPMTAVPAYRSVGGE